MQKWEYVSETVAPGKSWNEVLREMGELGWQAWHLTKDERG